jgi:mersacidin/lichenicidin family type 2 lantibiotic
MVQSDQLAEHPHPQTGEAMKKNKIDVVRAWRDEDYRNSLSVEEKATLPEHPAGEVELADVSLRSIAGGCSSNPGGITNAGYQPLMDVMEGQFVC